MWALSRQDPVFLARGTLYMGRPGGIASFVSRLRDLVAARGNSSPILDGHLTLTFPTLPVTVLSVDFSDA